MRSPFLDLLRRVAEGVVIYEPFPRSAQGLSEFQDTLHRLREMERLGLIGRLFVQTRTSRDAEYVDMVMVQGGLTKVEIDSKARQKRIVLNRAAPIISKLLTAFRSLLLAEQVSLILGEI
jgi:hypothetical protein